MNHTYTKLWTHVVFSTKNREHLILPPLEPRLYTHIHDYMLELGCVVRIINGTSNHIHILFLQSPNKSLAEIIKNVKSNSSHWVNQNELSQKKFSWQAGYGAFSVSESQVLRVHTYIANQKAHHLKEDFIGEYQHLIELHKLKVEEI